MTASDLYKAKALVLDYHRRLPSKPRFAACLIGTPPIRSIDDLDAVYAELLKAGELEAVGTAQAIDQETGRQFGFGSLYRCRHRGIQSGSHPNPPQ
jgi:hypothetical protein